MPKQPHMLAPLTIPNLHHLAGLFLSMTAYFEVTAAIPTPQINNTNHKELSL